MYPRERWCRGKTINSRGTSRCKDAPMGVEVGVGVGVSGVECDVKQLAKVVQVPLIQ